MTKLFNFAFILFLIFLFSFGTSIVHAEDVAPGYKFHARWPGYSCGDAPITDYYSGNDHEITFTAPAGGVITGVCFFTTKSFHNDYSQDGTYRTGCYTVKGIGTNSVTVTLNNVNQNCMGVLSHMDVYGTGLAKVAAVKSPVPSPSPEISPSPSPEPTPSLEPSPSMMVESVTEEVELVWWKRVSQSVIGWFSQWFTR